MRTLTGIWSIFTLVVLTGATGVKAYDITYAQTVSVRENTTKRFYLELQSSTGTMVEYPSHGSFTDPLSTQLLSNVSSSLVIVYTPDTGFTGEDSSVYGDPS